MDKLLIKYSNIDEQFGVGRNRVYSDRDNVWLSSSKRTHLSDEKRKPDLRKYN
jgi:hypothetical protein